MSKLSDIRLNWLSLPALGSCRAAGAFTPTSCTARDTRVSRLEAAKEGLALQSTLSDVAEIQRNRSIGSDSHEPLLQVRGLTKVFGGLVAVSDLDFDVYPGEIVAMIGPNGAGKTTVFNVLTATYRATAGSMRFRGRDISRMAPHQVARLGLVRTFQNLKLFANMTALDNVKVGRYCRTRAGVAAAIARLPWTKKEEREIEQRAMEILEFVGLADKAGEIAKSLPYGEQKLLEIARALATDPVMLLLDEPAAGLNSAESAELVQLVRRIRADGITVMLIEHDMKVVMSISERIIVLDHGIRIAEGTPAEICRNQQVIEAYLGKAV